MDLIKPMLASPGTLPQNDNDYAYEIKWDGIRTICYIKHGRMLLSSRNLRNITGQYPELSALTEVINNDIIIDGEIVALSQDGRPSFELLQSRINLSSPQIIARRMKQIPVTYVIFDLLQLGKQQLLNKPFLSRRHALAELNLSGPFWQTSNYHIGNGISFQSVSRQLGLEGIVAKRLTSLYLPGKRTSDWLKIKNYKRQELIICGWVSGQGTRAGKIGALLVGYYDTPKNGRQLSQKLIYAGKVGTGFTANELNKLIKLLAPLKRSQSPFDTYIPIKNAVFVEPKLVAEFEFTEWTSTNTLRHPSYKGLRTDKAANLVTRET